jgi:hypothetical protein
MRIELTAEQPAGALAIHRWYRHALFDTSAAASFAAHLREVLTV